MKVFLGATKELYTGKGLRADKGLTNTQTKLGEVDGMPYNGTGPHAWFKEPVRKRREQKTEWK